MAGTKRTQARITGAEKAQAFAIAAGKEVKASRRRRRLSQRAVGASIGVSRAHIAKIEAGKGAGVPPEVWFALGEALGRSFRAGFLRDGLAQPEHAAHLDIQELVLRTGHGAGYAGRFELATRPADPARSSDAPLLDRRRRRLLLVECHNTFGDLAGSARSSDRKLAEAAQLAIALAGDGPPYTIGLCWVVRDTAANRATVDRYAHIFGSRFPGSSAGWVKSLTTGAAPPAEPGLIWCDARATRLFARRRGRAAA
jgi:transcriptional regulator with XRE-family HTH domain